ncbi:MAG: hypothetical protein QOJ71_749, partial [Actinomycetota bacterium]|nr:hypothetical protein [Actinomycetota bacterium]
MTPAVYAAVDCDDDNPPQPHERLQPDADSDGRLPVGRAPATDVFTARDEATLQADLARAVADNELRLDYQPIVALETAEIVGYEALVRWEHPVRGRLEPGDFLGIAQCSAAGAAIDDWVLIEACREAAVWSPSCDLTVCVNVAPERFAAPTFAERLRSALDTTGLDPSRLLLEMTEWSVLADVDAARHTLEGLRSLGVRVALDDYGTGYS